MGLVSRDSQSQEEAMEEQRKDQEHMQNLANNLQEAGVDPAYADRIIESDLEQGTVRILSNLLSRDWVLSNLNEAEVHEVRWLSRVMMKQLESLHPNEESIWQGEVRKYAFDEERQALKPLDSAQRLVIFEFIQGVVARAARSKDGWQQETLKKQITASERIDRDNDDDGGWL